uniref:Uncharacterized protein n=1 Tax=Podoviridae sp. ct8Lf7 TaxID=2827723 RepID=A0A8S5S1K7_9CAUD|nr:MAG TPA: hypothetical protein [Podoviridae sp. ct8Lf7]
MLRFHLGKTIILTTKTDNLYIITKFLGHREINMYY